MGGQALISELNHFDLFLTGGTILTGNSGQPEIHDGSIGVRDGKITWLGHGTPQSGHTTKRVLKLAGCVVTPGFVNTHTHTFVASSDVIVRPTVAPCKRSRSGLSSEPFGMPGAVGRGRSRHRQLR